MNMPLDASTVIFALLAVFVVWKLRSVLGTRVEIEKKPDAQPRFSPDAPAAREAHPAAEPAVAAPPPAGLDAPTLAASRGLDDIRRADRTFDAARFVEGAQAAYRMIVEAFSKGDRALLQNLLGDEALRAFLGALDARGASANVSRVADIERVQITQAALKGTTASVTLRFKAHIVETPATPPLPGAAPSSAGQTIEANDVWTFARDVRSGDPNWKLVATSTEDAA